MAERQHTQKKGSDWQFDLYLNYLNVIDADIKFNVEKEGGEIHFLDPNCFIRRVGDHPEFSMYRKSTRTDSYTNHLWMYKMAELWSMY